MGETWASDICPRFQIDERSEYLCRLYTHYRNGVLWTDGGVSNQPNVYAYAMEVIATRAARIANEKLNKASKNANRL